jgi:hypothetical protein
MDPQLVYEYVEIFPIFSKILNEIEHFIHPPRIFQSRSLYGRPSPLDTAIPLLQQIHTTAV